MTHTLIVFSNICSIIKIVSDFHLSDFYIFLSSGSDVRKEKEVLLFFKLPACVLSCITCIHAYVLCVGVCVSMDIYYTICKATVYYSQNN